MILDEQVQVVMAELSEAMCAARSDLGLKQWDVGQQIGVTTATIHRFETDGGSAKLTTFLSYLNVLGQLDTFRNAMSLPREPRQQSRKKSHQDLRPEGSPYSVAQFNQHMEEQPTAELRVTRPVAMTLLSQGYLTRSEYDDNTYQTSYFATSYEGARNLRDPLIFRDSNNSKCAGI